MGERLTELEKQAHDIAGTVFNLASPKQLGEILFDKLGFRGVKKKKKNRDRPICNRRKYLRAVRTSFS